MCAAEAVPETVVKIPPITIKQAYYLANGHMLGRGEGFASFVPEWDRVIEGVTDPGQRAVILLTEAGVTQESASEAISYLRKSKPESESGKWYRGNKGYALLFRQEIPAEPSVSPVAHLPRPPVRQEPSLKVQGKPEMGQLDKAQLELALAEVRLAKIRLQIAGGDPDKK